MMDPPTYCLQCKTVFVKTSKGYNRRSLKAIGLDASSYNGEDGFLCIRCAHAAQKHKKAEEKLNALIASEGEEPNDDEMWNPSTKRPCVGQKQKSSKSSKVKPLDLSAAIRHTMTTRPDSVSNFRLEGLVCAPCTPFKPNGDVNLDIYDSYVQHLNDRGVFQIFATGTTGECNSMTVPERKQVLEAWLKAGKEKLKAVVAHIGAANLRESKELAAHAEKAGAHAIACVGPTYFKPESLECYVEYMAQVAASAPSLPFYLYDIDFFTGITYNLDDFFTLARPKIPTLRGIKHTSPHFPSMNTLVVNHPEMQVILGSDEMFLQAMSIGMDVTVMNSYQGVILTKLMEAFKRGDMDEAREQQARALKVCNIRRNYGFTVPGGTKAVLNVIGFDVGQPRLPLKAESKDTLAKLQWELMEVGYFDWGMPEK